MHKEKTIVLSMVMAIFLAGCSDDAETKKNSQVVAKVNDIELTVHQLNYELGLLGQAAAKSADKVAGKTLENMVNQQIVMQKAITEKLDRDPQVMQALERARRQVLDQAYMSKVVGRDTIAPSKQEISDYYNQHPDLFAKRRIYQIREILLDKTLPFSEIQAQMNESKSLEKFVGWLESKKVKMQSGVVTKPAEQLPLEMLSRLAKMQQGQIMAFETPANFSLSILMGARDQPLNEAQATPAIQRFLTAQKREKLADAEIKRLRSEAKVELLGKFSEKEAEKAPSVAAAPTIENTVKNNADSASGDADFIKKGAAGL